MKKIYVGNLSYGCVEDDLIEIFSAHGEVGSCVIIRDKFTNRAKGFGFVEMEESAAESAIAALDGSDHMGRTIKVNFARPLEQRSNSGHGGGNNRRSHGGGGGNRRYNRDGDDRHDYDMAE